MWRISRHTSYRNFPIASRARPPEIDVAVIRPRAGAMEDGGYHFDHTRGMTDHERRIHEAEEAAREQAQNEYEQEHHRELALITACAEGNVEKVGGLIRNTDLNFWGCTALSMACKHSHVPCVKLLLRKQANPDQGCEYGRTCLLAACMAPVKDAAIVKALLDGGADADRTDVMGLTALTYAAFPSSGMGGAGSSSIIRLLCQKQASLIPETGEAVPLEYVVKNSGGHAPQADDPSLECIQLLGALGGRRVPPAVPPDPIELDATATYAPWLQYSRNFTPLMCLAHVSPALARALVTEDRYSFAKYAKYIPARDDLGEPPPLMEQIQQTSMPHRPRAANVLAAQYGLQLWRESLVMRRIVLFWHRVSSERACAPGGLGRKRDLEQFMCEMGDHGIVAA